MQLSAILTREDLASAVDQLTPLSVTLRRRRVIWLGRPSTVALVAGRGLRLRGDARFTWDVGGLAVPVSLRSWQVLLVPSFAVRGGRPVLALAPELEALDFKSVPVFLDTKITQAINDGLAAQKNRLAWDFGRSLSLVRALPETFAPGGDLRLGPRGGEVTVSGDDVRLTLDFELAIRRAPSATHVAATDVISQCRTPPTIPYAE